MLLFSRNIVELGHVYRCHEDEGYYVLHEVLQARTCSFHAINVVRTASTANAFQLTLEMIKRRPSELEVQLKVARDDCGVANQANKAKGF